MAGPNTTEIDLVDSNKASDQYKALINSKSILMIVLGDSKNIKDGVDLADEIADTSPGGFSRKIMWVKNFTTLRTKLEPFLTAASLIEDDTPYEEIKVFCLSTEEPRKAYSRIHKNGAMRFSRLEELFIEAESHSVKN